MSEDDLETGSMPVAARGDGWARYGRAGSALGRVVVPAVTHLHCPASLALRTEWVPHEVTLVAGAHGYSELLAETWRGASGFVLVEHDIVPWPGALYQLWACPEPWCGFFYPQLYGRLAGALGCTKFGPELVVNHPEVARQIAPRHWDELDGPLCSAVAAVTGRSMFHLHTPAVGHARGRLYP